MILQFGNPEPRTSIEDIGVSRDARQPQTSATLLPLGLIKAAERRQRRLTRILARLTPRLNLSAHPKKKRKIGQFENSRRNRVGGSASGVISDNNAPTALVSGAVCPLCHAAKLVVHESAGKRKSLWAFLELYCDNSECRVSAFCCVYFKACCARRC